MINIELENEIIQYISNQYRPRWISLNIDWNDYLLQRWEDCNNIKESYLRIKYNILSIPKCPICGNNCKFRGNNWIYDSTCGNKECSNKLRQINVEKTIIQKYGCKTVFSNKKCREKAKHTKLKKYGDKNYNNR